ncbi:MAG: glycoside hydrolase family 13 protein [Firmicutes bacterium]|nr:glycoside hydrolase family 13 protein [Bacillota bacterium]
MTTSKPTRRHNSLGWRTGIALLAVTACGGWMLQTAAYGQSSQHAAQTMRSEHLSAHRAGAPDWQSELYANSWDSFYRSPFGAAPTGSQVVLRLVGPAAMTAAAIDLSNVNANANATTTIAMHRLPTSYLKDASGIPTMAGRSVWEGTIPAVDLAKPGVLNYSFEATDHGVTAYYANNGDGYGGVGGLYPNAFGVVNYSITVYARTFTTPAWLRHGIIYEIFPDRFDNGNKANDENPKTQLAIGAGPDGQEALVPIQFHNNWYSTPYDPNVTVTPGSPDYKEELALHGNGNWNTDFFGGDLRGIIDRLGYLQSLGVNTLYLTPIFQSESNHKYDTGNFMEIDPGFGTLKTYVDLVRAAKARGMHIILDGVFEDTGSDSLYFNKFGNYKSVGAWQENQNPSLKSPYYSFYEWSPGNTPPYVDWSGVDTLPQTNTSAKSWQQFVYGKYDAKDPTNPATNSVAAYWLSMGASGWRLDSANNSNFSVAWWTAFRSAVKKVDPQAAIIGEDWNNPTNDNGVDWLTGTTWDSTMNYPFRDAMISFFRGNYNDGNVQNYAMTASTFGDTLMQMLEQYPQPAMYAMMNLLGSQDTERILTILEGAPDATGLTAFQQATWKPTPAQQALGVAKLEEATAFQYGFVGVPDIYYGDEAGMIGFSDPLNRGTYPWGRANEKLIAYFQLLGKIRNGHPVLQSGNYTQLFAQRDALAYARTIRGGKDALGHPAKDATAIVAVNNGPARTLVIPMAGVLKNGALLEDSLHGGRRYVVKNGNLTISMAGYGAVMLFAE